MSKIEDFQKENNNITYVNSMHQLDKIIKSINKLGLIEIVLVLHRIKTRCIKHAKTDMAKTRLVNLAEQVVYEKMKRNFVPHYHYPNYDKKHNYEYKPFRFILTNWFKNLWK